MQTIESVPSPVLVHILTFLKAAEFSTLRECSRSLNSFFLHDANPLWYHVLAYEFGFDLNINSNELIYCLNALNIGPKKLRSQRYESYSTSIFGYKSSESVITCQSPYESVKLWRKANRIFHNRKKYRNLCINGPYFLRAARFWEKVETWCNGNTSADAGRMIMRTLSPGASKGDGPCANLNNKCAQAIEGIYAFHQGQLAGVMQYLRDPNIEPIRLQNLQCALFGTFSVYNHDISMIMIAGEICFEDDSKVILSRSVPGQKVIYLDTQNRSINCIPSGQDYYILNENTNDCEDPDDIGLRWFEEYGRRLECNEIEVRNKHSDRLCALCPFPCPPSSHCSVAVTRGIQVIASSVPALEIGYVAYSIRIKILLPGENGYMSAEERGFETCQLSTRHLRITDIHGGTSEVNGPGVIGRHPLLSEGKYRDDYTNDDGEIEQGFDTEGEFQYQSMTDADSDSFEGKLFMIPGSMKNPSGQGFYIDINRFSVKATSSSFTYF